IVWTAGLPDLVVPEPATETGNGRLRESDSTAHALAANLSPRLVVEGGPGRDPGEEIPLGGGLTIGRSRSNDLHLDDTYVSHVHARILRRGSFYQVQDLGSTNGTFLNGQRVEGAQLRPRDVLRMGETTLRYEE
ncbi:MAG TPA: FHA domain-containing protein, partial [Miltoncostaeaceae bacterium]|nr:FHA domain-containing protein [Miltoncostaeaceae bacterium]